MFGSKAVVVSLKPLWKPYETEPPTLETRLALIFSKNWTHFHQTEAQKLCMIYSTSVFSLFPCKASDFPGPPDVLKTPAPHHLHWNAHLCSLSSAGLTDTSDLLNLSAHNTTLSLRLIRHRVAHCVSLLTAWKHEAETCFGSVWGIFQAALLFAAGRHVDFCGAEAHYAADKTRLKVETRRERMLSALIPELWLPISHWFIKVFVGVWSQLWVVFSPRNKIGGKKKSITRELRKRRELLHSETTLLCSTLMECGGEKCITDDWSITLCSVAGLSVSLSASFTPVFFDRWSWKWKKENKSALYFIQNKSSVKVDISELRRFD